MANYYGLYRATVVSTADPRQGGRVRVNVPGVAVQGGWASACVPAGSLTSPQPGATVWVMFEAGDPSMPVYMGTMRRGV